jgi:cyclase
MSAVMLDHFRVLRPYPHIFAFYDGRIPGYRFAEGPNWVDDGAISLGIASYAIVDDGEALIYDTHVSVAHAAFIRKTLEAEGVNCFIVVLSHWHLDHIAGTQVFADCPVIANRRTMALMEANRAAIEAGTHHGAPAIKPLVMPTDLFEGHAHIHIGKLHIDLIEANIHSQDATVIWLGHDRILLAGDTLEDTVTYVAEPDAFDAHLADLDKLWSLDPAHILPNHGDPDIIAAGGYGKGIIRATQQYVRLLKRLVSEPDLRTKPLRDLIAGPLEAGWINWFEPYEEVHRGNIASVLAAANHGKDVSA